MCSAHVAVQLHVRVVIRYLCLVARSFMEGPAALLVTFVCACGFDDACLAWHCIAQMLYPMNIINTSTIRVTGKAAVHINAQYLLSLASRAAITSMHCLSGMYCSILSEQENAYTGQTLPCPQSPAPETL